MIFTLNNKQYEAKEVKSFRELCKMEKCGVDITALKEHSLNNAVGMISYITGLSKDKVYEEIDAHKKNGGSMEDIFKCFEILTECDFFK